MTERTGNIMFEFGIIICLDGTEIIDRGMITEYDELTPVQMIEYLEMDIQLELMDRMKRKERAEAERRRKIARNPVYRLACLCGLV